MSDAGDHRAERAGRLARGSATLRDLAASGELAPQGGEVGPRRPELFTNGLKVVVPLVVNGELGVGFPRPSKPGTVVDQLTRGLADQRVDRCGVLGLCLAGR